MVELPVPVPVVEPVPGTPASGMPAVPGPPDVPVFGALASGMVEPPDDDAPELSLVVPGVTLTPGEPDVAVPTEPEPDVDGRSALLVIASPERPVVDDDDPLPYELPAPDDDAPLALSPEDRRALDPVSQAASMSADAARARRVVRD